MKILPGTLYRELVTLKIVSKAVNDMDEMYCTSFWHISASYNEGCP
jgi:hypothetical protein